MTVIVGDCVEGMRELEPCSVDAVVCDPPYGLEFMGKDWDRLSTDAVARSWDTRGRTMTNAPKSSSQVTLHRKDNPRCDTCGRAINGRPTAKGFKVCECETPQPRLPSVSARKMQQWHEAWAREAFRVLKPGGHLLAFGGTRTYHRLAAGIEDAGFEIRDCLAWMYGSGFPKSLDVSKAIDARAGAQREVVGRSDELLGRKSGIGNAVDGHYTVGGTIAEAYDVTAPATDEARHWEGWGTALKPAHEPIVLARKPLAGTVAGNVLAHGTGALNIDGCRIEGAKGDGNWVGMNRDSKPTFIASPEHAEYVNQRHDLGRWPANVVLDEHAAHMLDQQTGNVGGGDGKDWTNGPVHGNDDAPTFFGRKTTGVHYGDSGGASRFFYTAKASRAERNAGLDGFEERERGQKYGLDAGGNTPQQTPHLHLPQRNVHPTVKPVALMRWLVKLITPPGGTVLDPFIGSGTTGIAAHLENLRFIGYERDPDYAKIAEARIAYWQQHGHDTLRIVAEQEQAERARAELEAAGQLTLEGTA